MFGLVDLVNPTTAGYPAEHSARLFVSKADIESLIHSIETDAADRQDHSVGKTEVVAKSPSRLEGVQVESASVAKKGGRPEKKGPAIEIFRDRVKRGVTKPRTADEAREIVKEWTKAEPPEAKSVAKWIRHEHQDLTFRNGKVVSG